MGRLTPEVAEAFTIHDGLLILDGLRALSAEAATALAKNWGKLYLRGLTKLSLQAAESLRAHPDIHLPKRFR